jgi:aquaporin NIP
MKQVHQWPQYMAEAIGTFFLVFFGCGSMVLAETNSNYAGSLVPVIWGGAVSVMIYATGHISGAHFNPAVTVAFWSIKRFPGNKVFAYLLAQCLGAIIASFVIYLIWGGGHQFGATNLSVNLAAGFLVEVILSFALMFVIVSVATDARAVGELAGLAIGSTVALCAFVGGPLTKASMNPARSLGPALFAGEWGILWLYFLAPLMGTVLGAKVYELIRCQKEADENAHGCC